ncbi:NADH-cytochrome b5 reductase [Linnemannia zychae]|nr:NADH-cytochrome b5 reductase [Linnemannia zychae]
MASGLPLTGTKPILANRLVTYLASIMDKIDNLEPEFFLHNSSSCNSVTTPFRNATSTSFPRASFFSSVATNPAASTVENTDTDITLPLDNHSNGSGGQIDAEMMAKIKDRILPRSIVSIDIGIRNLAWVELSKDGEILRWAIEDLVPPSPTLDDRPNSALKEDEDEEWTGADNKTKRRSSSTKRANKKQAPVSSPYDPRAMALRLDTVMRTILESNTVDGIILERQRFRSRGMPMVLDSAFKCGVIEGMIHTWFAFWEREQSSRGGKRLAEGEDEDDRKGERKVPMFIESVPPRAVAVRWGIGASGAQAKDALSRRKKKQELLGSVDTVADAIESDTVSGPAEEESSNVQSPARPKKSLTYHHKKTQSRSIVNQWIHDKPSSDSSSSSDPADTGLVTGLSPPSKFQVRCSPAMKEWYRQEQKQDDLSDCLLQAVAWFEWKDRAVQEAVERSMLTGDATVGVVLVSAYFLDASRLPVVGGLFKKKKNTNTTTTTTTTTTTKTIKTVATKTLVLDAKEYRKFKLVDKVVVSPNTAMYKFALPNEDDILNLPIGQHISIMANINGKEVMRSYTPTSSSDDLGHFVLCIKSYPQGNISKMFSELSIGDTVNVRGPKGQFNYTPNMCRAIGMIAGGTGLTPMLQIIRAIVKNPEDKTLVNFIFANVNEDDILLKAELDLLAKKHPQFKVHYVLNNAPEGWTGGVGFVNADMIKEHMPAPASDIKVLLCGPPPMISAMTKITQEFGYDKVNAVSKLPDQVFKF